MHNRPIRRHSRTLLLISAIGVSAFAGEPASGQVDMAAHASEVAALHRRGVNYHSFGEHDQAIADFNVALTIDPSFAFARVSRGYTYLAQGDEVRALEDFNMVVETVNPAWHAYQSYAAAHIGRGRIAFGKKKYDQAIADFTKAAEWDRTSPAAYANRAQALFEQGKLADGLADVDRALWVEPQYGPAYSIRSRIYRALDRPLEATDDAMRARLFEAFEETLRLLVRGRDKTIPVDDSSSSGPGPPGRRNYGTRYPSLASICADNARQVLLISMGAGMVAVRPAYAAAGGTISVLPSGNGMTFLLGHEECRIKVTIAKAGNPPAQSDAQPSNVLHDAEAPLFEHRFYEPSQACVAATLRVRAFWGHVEVIDKSLLSPNQHRWNNPRPAPGVGSHRFGDTGCEIEIQTSKAE